MKFFCAQLSFLRFFCHTIINHKYKSLVFCVRSYVGFMYQFMYLDLCIRFMCQLCRENNLTLKYENLNTPPSPTHLLNIVSLIWRSSCITSDRFLVRSFYSTLFPCTRPFASPHYLYILTYWRSPHSILPPTQSILSLLIQYIK